MRSVVVHKTIKLGRGSLTIALAAKNTCWWGNHSLQKYNTRIREDKIISFTRVYSRKARRYLWVFVIGRLKLMWSNW